jgi:hypothetical protein
MGWEKEIQPVGVFERLGPPNVRFFGLLVLLLGLLVLGAVDPSTSHPSGGVCRINGGLFCCHVVTLI